MGSVPRDITTFEALKEILPKEYKELIDYFDSCRGKRNVSDYDRTGGISEQDADEILKEVKSFKQVVMNWLKTNYPGLIPSNNIKG